MAVPENDAWKGRKDNIGSGVECAGNVDQRHNRSVRYAFSLVGVDEQVGRASTSEGDEEDEDDAVKSVDSGRGVDQAALPFYDDNSQEEYRQADLEQDCGKDVESVVHDDKLWQVSKYGTCQSLI